MRHIFSAVISFAVLFFSLNLTLAQESPTELYFSLPDSEGEIIETEKVNFYVQEAVSGLNSPWGMAFLPDGRMLITEKSGNLVMVENGEVHEQSIGGVPEVLDFGQGGFMDVVLHPNYEENGWIYFSYTKPLGENNHTAIARARLNGHELIDFEELFVGDPPMPTRFHFGSRIAFDSNGYLFFSIGDRGVMNLAQDLDNHAGKVFRLYDDGRIPSDNPFVDEAGAKPEIFTLGNRNPQGMVTHPVTGEIWTNEHGPRGGDEINIIRSGRNFGWPLVTHGINYNGSIITEKTEMEGMEYPLYNWTPSIAPSGMAIVHGDRYPAWNGDAINGALAQQHVNRIEIDYDNETGIHEERILQGIGRVRDLRVAPDGFIYVMVERMADRSARTDGFIVRLVPEGTTR